jgi:arylsulfatase A-like enzyme
MTHGHRRATLALLGAAAALAGCGRGGHEAAIQRWINTLPAAELTAEDLRDVRCLQHFEFPDGSLPPGLELVDGTIVEGVGSGLTIRGGTSAPRLRFQRPLAPDQVNGARVVVSGLRRGKVRFSWQGAPQSESATERMSAGAGSGPLHDRFVLDWSGLATSPAPGHLELEPTTAAGEIVTLSEVCVGAVRDPGDLMASVATKPWYVTVDGETREALVLAAGSEVSKSVELPSQGRFEFGVGRLAGVPQGVRLRVSARNSAGPRTLLDVDLAPELLADRWRDFVVDLSQVEPGPAELTVQASAPAPDSSVVLALATPAVLGRVRDPRPNIVLVSIDTLRADHLSLYGYERPTSPRLDAWARRNGVVFEHVVAPSGWTLPSHFSLFTGLEAFRHAANYYKGAFDASDYRFLAEMLRDAGYRTVAVTGGGFVHPEFGLGRGFERFRYWKKGVQADDELVTHVGEAQAILDREDAGPFFLFFHTYEVHTPNPARQPFFSRFSTLPADLVSELVPDPPNAQAGFLGSLHEAYRRDAPGSEVQRLPAALAHLPVDAYDSAVAYTDDRLGPLLERLSSPPLADHTLVAVFSDHGETLAATGRAGHGYLSLDNLLVPLVIAGPGSRFAPREVVSQVRLIDLFATVLDVAGLPLPDGTDSRSLLDLLEGGSERGRAAFAYAASTNFGLALLSPEGVKLEWQNSPWRPLGGRVLWHRFRDFGEEPLAAPPEGIAADKWLTEVRDSYARGIPGLRLEVSTDARQAVEVEIVSDLVDPVSTKTLETSTPGLVWQDVGRLSAKVDAARPLRLQFERIPRRELGFTVAAWRDPCRTRATVKALDAAKELGSSKTWLLELRACGAAPPARVEVSASWHGPLPTGELAVPGAGLEKDLRALGYLR